MLIRCVFNNIYSFGEQKEFNMLPRPRYRTHNHHKYDFAGFQLLKMASVYGANGAGKSNLVRSIELLQDIVLKEELPFRMSSTFFKFQKNVKDSSQLLAIEFLNEDIPFYYAMELRGDLIAHEELYISGLSESEDELVFERSTNKNKITNIKFFDDFESDTESQVLKKIIEKNLSKHNKPILKLLTTLDNPLLEKVKIAFDWFDNVLQIISPTARPVALAHTIDRDKEFRKYTRDIMCSFNIGVKDIRTETKELYDFFGENDKDEIEELIKDLEDSSKEMLGLRSRGDELVVVKEDEGFFVKQLILEHIGKSDIIAAFDLDEESDGTVRLLDFVPAFKNVVSKRKVYVIDEIERSIHPLLIKELIKKFSFDDKTLGQIIFTTHESNLLNQDIFRQDEIWFAEKDKSGSTDLYSLSDFKEHNTIDVRKGYLTGRYGSIPFLANLQDLNWHGYVTQE